MQENIFYITADKVLGAVRGFVNAKPAAPMLVKGVFAHIYASSAGSERSTRTSTRPPLRLQAPGAQRRHRHLVRCCHSEQSVFCTMGTFSILFTPMDCKVVKRSYIAFLY